MQSLRDGRGQNKPLTRRSIIDAGRVNEMTDTGTLDQGLEARDVNISGDQHGYPGYRSPPKLMPRSGPPQGSARRSGQRQARPLNNDSMASTQPGDQVQSRNDRNGYGGPVWQVRGLKEPHLDPDRYFTSPVPYNRDGPQPWIIRASGQRSKGPGVIPKRFQSNGTLLTGRDLTSVSQVKKYDTFDSSEREILDKWIRDQLFRVSRCANIFPWYRVPGGYICDGDWHLVTDQLLEEGRYGVYERSSSRPRWHGPHYPRKDTWWTRFWYD
jgi:hypothetical protein